MPPLFIAITTHAVTVFALINFNSIVEVFVFDILAVCFQ